MTAGFQRSDGASTILCGMITARSFLVIVVAAGLIGCGRAPEADPGAPDTATGIAPEQEAFWDRLQEHCGRAYSGTVDDVTEYYRPGLEGKALVAHVRECTADRIHIALHENGDRSRNWILTKVGGTLRLKHDHRHEDGTEDDITQYGGDAPGPGLPERQIFRADEHTAQILPLRSDNFWFFHFVDDRTLHYGVHWPTMGHSVRLAFDLSTPIEAPPPPWGYQ
jgi:hypothetical protein